ncbi:WD repeat-containing protein 76 [Microdochium nivale]|nr:WD repeat-containing protein 76 [Microdochium nivale]
MASYEARRLHNIKQNAALVRDLGLTPDPLASTQQPGHERARAPKRQKTAVNKEPARPTRASARIAKAPLRPVYDGDGDVGSGLRTARRATKKATPSTTTPATSASSQSPRAELPSIVAGWTSWTPEAPPPTFDDTTGAYRFPSHPDFTPNKSPESILREGCFGGSYFRPLYSRHLRTTIEDDWRELPAEWTSGLNVSRYLTSPAYDPEINKYGVACGQSIEEWEAAGWIRHEHDVRGWFQWYCRFWMGRRCADDERQIGRWKKCVGTTGRWRRILLKKYVAAGIRSVMDEGDESQEDDGGRGGPGVSPVVHQTCHHWAFEVRQDTLDRFWREGK